MDHVYLLASTTTGHHITFLIVASKPILTMFATKFYNKSNTNQVMVYIFVVQKRPRVDAVCNKSWD